LKGEQVSKFLLTGYCDHLQLEITEAIIQQTRQRHFNKLTSSNEGSGNKLWTACSSINPDNELLKKDEANLQSHTDAVG